MEMVEPVGNVPDEFELSAMPAVEEEPTHTPELIVIFAMSLSV
jgi:hypothetical protein